VDFVRPARPVAISFVSGKGHYDTVIAAVRAAKRSVWIATANLKELMVEDHRWTSKRRGTSYRSIIEIFAELAEKKVDLRILHASAPSGPFRAELRRHPVLVRGGLVMSLCPRVHFKAVVVDAAILYLGSANWTGAGLGAKGVGRRNFELGFLTDDDLLLDEVQAMFDAICRGTECAACRLRDVCPAPLDGRGAAPVKLTRRRKGTVP
jgi:phosphatidylserine/phosphatidylglycerophosphate/cardiolipin synthase-like enzyme